MRGVQLGSRARSKLQPPARRPAVGLATAATTFIFAALSVLVLVGGPIRRMDRTITDVLGVDPGTTPFQVLSLVDDLGSFPLVAAVCLVLGITAGCRRRDWRLALFCVVSPGLTNLTEMNLKTVFALDRPPSAEVAGTSGFGFPSGHSAMAAAAATVCTIWLRAHCAPPRFHRGLECTAVICAVSVAAARVAVGVHFVSDALGGLLVGAGVSLYTALIVGAARIGGAPPNAPQTVTG